ncbi:alpha/beta hydrolase [Phragmitibacter flavus]|uniref:Alpha/beta hydrolase n=1 Tax=Phragmitibacter flavus TaxID=2576071 RepID=A0A5R8KIM4_9BACT|nr:alpha/beta hydrolase [Phragmitibacter flavus]TLD72091.1 alpha/beta hydrolase [Phragmitibacter flavus]
MLNGPLILFAGVCLIGLSACNIVPKERTTSSSVAADESSRFVHALTRAEAASTSDLSTPEQRRNYADAINQVVDLWQKREGPTSGDRTMIVQGGEHAYRLSASWPKNLRFDELVPAAPLNKRYLPEPLLRDGVGAAFVSRWHYSDERKKREPFLSDGGYMTAVTVILDFRNRGNATREAILRVHDPRTEKTTTIAGRNHPLYSDFSSASELIHSLSEQKNLGMSGLGALRNSEKFLDKLGLISLEPLSRDRIPVICVHGLMSRPVTWLHAFNVLGADPEIAKNYQVFFFRYPSGVPVIYSAAKFRAQLTLLHEEFTRIGNHRAANHMVLIGHSMGGLVSKMQLVSSGDQLWVKVFGAPRDQLGLTQEELDDFRQYLEFSPNPHVDRVIFVCTPHRGSSMADGFAGAIGRRLIRLPGRVLGNTFDLLQGDVPRSGLIKQLLEKGLPSSIDNLSSKSRFVVESNRMPIKPGLHMHSIIGNKDGRPLTDLKCSDGVVPYNSAHIEGVDSEFVVRSDHGAQTNPEAIAEIQRILLLHKDTLPNR